MIRLSDFITVTSTMQFFFRTSDFAPDINITEAALDLFFISETAVGLGEVEENNYVVYPNPVYNYLFVEGLVDESEYEVFNTTGQLVLKGQLGTQSYIDVECLNRGVYVLKIEGRIHRFVKN